MHAAALREQRELAALREQIASLQADGITSQRDLADALGVSTWQIRKALGAPLGRSEGFVRSERAAPVFPQHQRTTPLAPVVRLSHASALIVADLHIPHHNAKLLERAVYVATTFHPTVQTVVLIGDAFTFDAASRHQHNQPEETLETELRLGGKVLRALFNPFRYAVVCNGNHDERVARKLDAQLGLQFLIDAALGREPLDCELTVTDYDYVYLDDPAGERSWVVGHPDSFSAQGGKTPADIADVLMTNVVTGHNHRFGMQPSKSGRYLGVDTGHCTLADEHYYALRRLNKRSRWTAGFCVLDNGYPYLFSDQWTDWQSLGC